MILVDTSIWVDHFATGNQLGRLLAADAVRMHPAVVGELAMGSLADRAATLRDLQSLPAAREATHQEVLHLVEHQSLYSRGIGWIDAHLLAAALPAGDRLWTRDARLSAVARQLGIDFTP